MPIAPQARRRCSRCGSANLEPGELRSGSTASFVPFNPKKLTRFRSVTVFADLCLDCGAVDLVADLRKAREELGIPHPASTKSPPQA